MQSIQNLSKAKFFRKILVPAARGSSQHNKLGKDSISSTMQKGATTAATCSEANIFPSLGDVQERKNGQTEECCDSALVEKFTPCQPSDEGAVETSIWDLEPEMIHLPDPRVTYGDITAALSRTRTSVAPEEQTKMIEYTSNIDRFG